MSPADRAKAAHAAAEAADHPRDKAALKAAAAAWERIAGPGVAWGTKQLEGDLLRLRIDVVAYQGPFQPPQPPKAPSPAAAPLIDPQLIGSTSARGNFQNLPREATIEF